jgi:hypothetical protein
LKVMNIDQLRALWHERRGEEAPTALSKDLIARSRLLGAGGAPGRP